MAGGAFAAYRMLLQPRQETKSTAVASVPTARVTVGVFERIARLHGQTSSRDFRDIKAPTLSGPESGREMILLYLIPSGTKVKVGDKLFAIDSQSLRDHIDDVQDTVTAAEADIRKRTAEQWVDRENLMQNLRVAKAEADKTRLDYSAAEVRTEVERELLRLAAEEAAARYKQLQADVAQKEIVYKAELKILDITRQRHVRHRQRHENDLKRYTVTSPMEGMAVVQTTWRGSEFMAIQVGDQVRTGQMVVKVVNPEKMQVEATVNQVESSEFRVGQEARITLDAFPGVTLRGKIYSIGAIAVGGYRQNNYVRTVPVKVQIDGSHPNLIPDLSAGVSVILNRVENAVQVPVNALWTENGKSYAYVRNGKSWDKREVATGLRNHTHVQVLAGLSGGEVVALERPQGI